MDEIPAQPNRADPERTPQQPPVPPLMGKRQATENTVVSRPTTRQRQQKHRVNWPVWVQALSSIAMVFVTGAYTYFAWGIGPMGVPRYRLEVKQPFNFTVESRNTGNSPGFSFHSFVKGVQGNPPQDDIQRMTFPENNMCDNLPPAPSDGPMILPGSGFAMDYGSNLLPEPAQVEAILSGAVGHYILGCLRYTDTFGKLHHTKFCYFYNPFRKGFRVCRVGNYAD